MSADPWRLLAGVDIVVVGAGPAGAAAAAAAVAAGRSVLLIDASPPDLPFRVGESLPPGAMDLTRQIFGAGAFDESAHLRSHGNRSCWGSEEPVDTDFMFNPFGIGWHLDRTAFDDELVATVERMGVEVWRQSSVVSAELIPRGSRADGVRGFWNLEVAAPLGSVEVRASWLCDATGRRAAIARDHGASLTVHDRLVAVVAVLDARGGTDRSGGTRTVGHDGDDRTTVEAVESGWWYTATIPGQRRVAAFLTDGDLVEPGLRSLDGFRRALGATRRIGPLLSGSASEPGVRRNYRLARSPSIVAAGTSALDRPVGDGWIAVGDAAAAFDPLSSQGIVTALLMGRAGGELLATLAADPSTDTAPFEQQYAAIVDRFHTEHRATYAMEQRWPDSPFWQRRHRD